ncbi:hypothetical protein H4219_004327 [Mycoemilia scoparia]|uniref:Uncharacterized protein n=1 Tax=Mycoemilia scoparia TaxID=417184 RepID=A0A9W7ZS24_9FUNG|nr:hypothetical protein H4219_004327 [Mycoemilia scoparia]
MGLFALSITFQLIEIDSDGIRVLDSNFPIIPKIPLGFAKVQPTGIGSSLKDDHQPNINSGLTSGQLLNPTNATITTTLGSNSGGYWDATSPYVSKHQMSQWEDEVKPWSKKFPANRTTAMAYRDIPKEPGKRAKAAIIALVRNSELQDMLNTLKSFEGKFNSRYNYPYVFLNDEPFTQEFMDTISAHTSSETMFGLLPKDHWEVPKWIDQTEAQLSRIQMAKKGVIYASSLSYRKMCRFNSGFFYKHPLLQEFDWYWRIEPDVDFYCDLKYDPFIYMQENNKIYSFVIAIKEIRNTINNLWAYTIKYALDNNLNTTLLSYFTNDRGRGNDYNLCHFWSNFEIASLKFFRSDQYESYFQYLDKTGNFFYERYGDAPVHSLAAGLFLDKDQVHFFEDIGYRHSNIINCPEVKTDELKAKSTCQCPNLDEEGLRRAEWPCLGDWKEYEPRNMTNTDYRRILDNLSGHKKSTLFEVGSVGERRRYLNYLNLV